MAPEESFHRAFQYQEFDVSELSVSSYTMLTSRGEAPYVSIPAFVSRLFRHSGVYIRTDRGIDHPSKLSGRTIGLPEHQITAVVWIRGILEDEYGVDLDSIAWRQGRTRGDWSRGAFTFRLVAETRPKGYSERSESV